MSTTSTLPARFASPRARARPERADRGHRRLLRRRRPGRPQLGLPETHGPGPVNGFTLLCQAYEVTEPGFDGHVSVPVLWDTETELIVINDYPTLGIDLATQLAGFRWPGVDPYPVDLLAALVRLDAIVADRSFLADLPAFRSTTRWASLGVPGAVASFLSDSSPAAPDRSHP